MFFVSALWTISKIRHSRKKKNCLIYNESNKEHKLLNQTEVEDDSFARVATWKFCELRFNRSPVELNAEADKGDCKW